MSGACSSDGRLPLLGRIVARNRRNLIARKIAGACRRYLNWFGNLSYDLESNGEAHVLRTIARFKPVTIFDAGANVGDWAISASRHCPDAIVHAFEISPPTYAQLVENTKRYPNIRCTNVGLSDTDGVIKMRHYDDAPALTTATAYAHPFRFREIECSVTAGAALAARANVKEIDLLKIDVEGMEEQVLRGFESMLQSKSIGAIQFEYGRVNILNRFLLRDFYEFFKERGYVVGKIFPNHVDFRPYDLGDEDFIGPNYLACRADNSDWIGALQ